MAKQKKELTTKQRKNRLRAWQFTCKIGEYAVIPVPFFALMIVNRDEWFRIPDNTWKIGIAASFTIALMIGAIFTVIKESEDKHIANGFPLIIVKWIMAAIIITVIEQVLHQISQIMWIAISGLATSFGIDLTRMGLKKKADELKDQIKSAEAERGKQKAMRELEEEENKKVKIKIVN